MSNENTHATSHAANVTSIFEDRRKREDGQFFNASSDRRRPQFANGENWYLQASTLK